MENKALSSNSRCLFTRRDNIYVFTAYCENVPHLGMCTAPLLYRLQIAGQDNALLRAESFYNFGSGEAEHEARSGNL